MVRIVIVEDEVIVTRSIAKMLTLNGHEVPACVTTGADAVAAAAALRPDVMLMDVRLRGPMDGITAAEAIRAAADIPIVFLTAYGDREHLDRAKRATPYGYLIKPYSDRELLTTVEIAVHKHAVEREAAAQRASTVIGGVGHELNNPLASNLGNLELLAARLPGMRTRAAALGAAGEGLAAELAEAEGLVAEALAGAAHMQRVLAELREPNGDVPAVAADASTRRRRVLIVDDDASLLRLYHKLLDEHHDVVGAASGEEALAHVRAQTPDVVICDLMMAGMTGIELYDQVLAADAALADRFVFITGGAFTAAAQAFVAAMQDRVLFKPVTSRDLLDAVARVGR